MWRNNHSQNLDHDCRASLEESRRNLRNLIPHHKRNKQYSQLCRLRQRTITMTVPFTVVKLSVPCTVKIWTIIIVPVWRIVVGDSVGLAVGVLVGLAVGVSVGLAVGAAGVLVGLAVGDSVGLVEEGRGKGA